MADPRDELTYADMLNEPGMVPPREPLRIRVSPYDTPPPSDTGWGGFGAGGRPTGRLFEPDLEPAPPPESKPQFQPGLLSLGNVARGIGSLVQGARDSFGAPAQATTGDNTRQLAPRDPTAGPRQMFQQGYPSAEYSSMFKGPAEAVGHIATEVLQEPYNLVRAGQDVMAPGATEQQVQQARQQEAGAATNLATNLYGLNAPFAAARPASAGVFGGRLAETADVSKLQLAKSMAENGVQPGKVWKDTGWMQGADKQWRFEIPDLAARYKGDFDSITRRVFDQKYPERAGQYDKNPLRMQMAQQDALLKIQGKQQLYLPDIIDHPQLFEAYPELRKMPVEMDDLMAGKGGYMARIPSDPTAKILYRETDPGKIGPGGQRTANLARGDTFDTLLHEIQHAIQQIEGFARGSSSRREIKPGSPAHKIYEGMMRGAPDVLSREEYLNKYGKLDNYAVYFTNAQMSRKAYEKQALNDAGIENYRRSAGEGEARLPPQRKDYTPEQLASVFPGNQMRVPMEKQIVEFNEPVYKQGNLFGQASEPAQMGGVLNPAPREMQMSADPSGLLRPPGRTMKEENWLPVTPKPYVIDPQRVLKPGIYQNPRIIAEKAAQKVAAEHPALKELFGVTRSDLYDISQQGRRKGNAEPELFMPAKPGTSYAGANIQTPANEQRLIDTLGEGLKHRGLREGMVPWYVMDPMFQHMVKLVGKEQAIKDYTRLNAVTPPFSASSDVLTEINRGTAANMYAKRGDYETFHRYGGADRQNLPAGFPEDMSGVMGHAYHDVQSSPVMRWLTTGKHGYNKETVKIPTYIMASGVPETGFQTRWAVPDAHIARGSAMSDVRRTKSPGDYMGGSEYRTFAPWYREKIAKPLDLEAVPAQAMQWGTFGHATGVDTPIGAGKLELFSQRIWERARELGIDPKRLRDEVLQGNQHAIGLLTAGAGGAAGMGALVDPRGYQPGGS